MDSLNWKSNDDSEFEVQTPLPSDVAYIEKQNFTFKKVIGRGAFGMVYLIGNPQYNQDFAYKSVQKEKFRQMEVDCMLKISHVNVCNLYSVTFSDTNAYMLLDYCPTEFYRKLLNGPLQTNDMIRYTFELCKGLKACHDVGVAHRDLKPTNIMLDQQGRVKLCDFGLSLHFKPGELCTSTSGTLNFMAPEILKRAPYDPFKADIWALGVTMYIFATGRTPWCSSSRDYIKQAILHGNFNLAPVQHSEYRMLIKRCMDSNPGKRPTINEILTCPMFETAQPKEAFPGAISQKPSILRIPSVMSFKSRSRKSQPIVQVLGKRNPYSQTFAEIKIE